MYLTLTPARYQKRAEKVCRKKTPKKYEDREDRLTLPIRKSLLNLCFDIIDPEKTGRVNEALLKDIYAEMKYLIQHCKTTESRERQRFIVCSGQNIHEIEKEEASALKESIDLEEEEEEDEEAEGDDDDADLAGFVVSANEPIVYEPLQLTYTPPSTTSSSPPRSLKKHKHKKHKKRHIVVADDP